MRANVSVHNTAGLINLVDLKYNPYQLGKNRSGSEHDRSTDYGRCRRSLQGRDVVCLQHPESDLHVQ